MFYAIKMDDCWFQFVFVLCAGEDMEMFYMGGARVAPCPEVDMFYAIKMDDCWFQFVFVLCAGEV